MEALFGNWDQLSQLHFGSADLGDARRSKRLIKSAALIFQSPAGGLPQKLSAWADLNGLYRLVAARQVTHAAVIEPHLKWTRQQMQAAAGVVLLLHDTTELDFTAHCKVAGQLSQIGNGGGRGYLCHNTLAVTPGKQVIGLVSQILHLRRKVPKGEKARDKREHPDRESRLWARGCAQVGPARADALWVDIADRASDCFEFLEYEHAHHRRYVIRSTRNRTLDGEDHVGSDRIHHTLHGFAREQPTLLKRQIDVAASTKKGTKARSATVRIAASPITLAAPKQPRGQCTVSSLDLYVIYVAEVDPPADVEPVEWILLSNVPIHTAQQAAERVDWYACRPMIEDYHKGQKTGLGIELPQFESTDRLEPVIGILSVIAAALLQLRHQARDPRSEHIPAVDCVPLPWVKIVAQTAYKFTRKQSRTYDQLSIKEFFVGVACLGGFLNRKHDGSPGWLTLWRGWQRLHMMIQGAEAAAAMNEKCV
jgi:transposase-like protein/transposase Tn5 family protein